MIGNKTKDHKFPYEWHLKDGYNFVPYHGSKVFSCFACGGGSTMGYKMAGYDVLGCNEIDPKMNACYVANHKPKFNYLEPIQTFKNKELPDELFNLDILDGSPPCSSFSMAGNREKDWGKEKVFREGQSEQILDTLFFDFIDLAKRLQPKIVIAENVKGLLLGNAKSYVIQIYKELEGAGYYVQHFLLDASKMGVPQKRERVFFIALRKDLANPFLVQKDMFTVAPELSLSFNEKKIAFGDFADYLGRKITDHAKMAWDMKKDGDTSISDSKVHAGMKPTDFNNVYAFKEKVLTTITAQGNCKFILWEKPIYISNTELIKGGSFPCDYDFCNLQAGYVIGMSVPPVMTAQIAHRIYEQWINKFHN